MQVICAYCLKLLGKKKGKGISHGICKECFKKEEDKLKNFGIFKGGKIEQNN